MVGPRSLGRFVENPAGNSDLIPTLGMSKRARWVIYVARQPARGYASQDRVAQWIY